MPQRAILQHVNMFMCACGVSLWAFLLTLPMAVAAPTESAEKTDVWPKEKPIRLIVPFAPDGSTDICARILARHLEKRLSQKIRIVNIASPTGTKGFAALADAEPDGYTVGFINTPHFISAQLQGEVAYNFDSFVPVAGLMEDPVAILVRNDSVFTNLQAVVDHVRKNPGSLLCGTTGMGSDDHMTEVLMNRISNAMVRHKPFDGTATVRKNLMEGRVDLGIFNVGEAVPYVRSGELRCLGQASDLRSPLLPDVPTLTEQGYDVIMSSMRGLALPVGTPPQIVEAFANEIRDTVASPEFLSDYAQTTLPLHYFGPREFGERLLLVRVLVEKIWRQQPWVDQKQRADGKQPPRL